MEPAAEGQQATDPASGADGAFGGLRQSGHETEKG